MRIPVAVGAEIDLTGERFDEARPEIRLLVTKNDLREDVLLLGRIREDADLRAPLVEDLARALFLDHAEERADLIRDLRAPERFEVALPRARARTDAAEERREPVEDEGVGRAFGE